MELALPKTRHVTFGDMSFQAAVAKKWNKLPFYIRNSESLNAFKSMVKVFYLLITSVLSVDDLI